MSYVFLSDAPPLQVGGTGCQVLARDWLQAMGNQTRLIVTHRTLFGSDRARIEQDQTVPMRYYYNLGVFRLGRLPLLRRCLEWLAFLLVLPGLARAARRSGAQRIFALSGSAPGFLFFAVGLACASGLPLDIYLVDDYEETVRHGPQASLAPAVRYFEPRFLRRADRVFAISPGYVDHLWTKYGQRAHWLPVLGMIPPPAWQPFRPGNPDERSLVFVGSINFLYEASLVELYQAITKWNEDGPAFRLRLKLITRHRPDALLRRLPSTADLDLVIDADDATKTRHVRDAWAIFLPYSFAPDEKVFVTTSFSYKFTDAIAAGRPILVYGPAYASLPRYFREENLPLQANSADELPSALAQIGSCDGPETLASYADLLARNHSPQALQQVLSNSPSTRAGYPVV